MNFKLNALTLLVFSTGLAQVSFTNPDEAAVVSFQTKEIDISNVKTEGSPYFEKEFKYGKVFMNGEPKINGNLRYNAYTSEIELQRGNNEYTAILKRNNISAKIGNETYQLYPFTDGSNGNTRIGYFIPLNGGNITLLYKPEKKLRRGRTPSTSYEKVVPPRYIDVSSYYIKKGEEPAVKIYLKKRDFQNLLGKENVNRIMKAENLKLNKVEDAIKLLDHYNNS